MKRNRWICFALVVCILGSLSACARYGKPTIYELKSTQPSPDQTDSTISTAASPTGLQPTESQDTDTTPTSGQTGVTLERTGGLKSGSLLFTITGARMVDNQADMPTEGGFNEDAAIWQIIDNEEIVYKYPDFIGEDGAFVENSCLILVDITVESKDAVSYTTNDLTEEGRSRGLYDDPYLFRADNFWLADLTDKEGEFYYITDPTYFSLRGEREENNWVFQLEPGEKIRFTLGYIIGGYKRDGSLTDLSQLCLCDAYGNADSNLIKLGLGS